MKLLLILMLSLNVLFYASAHEGDEEVTAKFAPRFGGKVAAVIFEEHHHEESSNGKDDHHDEPKYMAEILVSDSNKVRLYFYDLNMKSLSLVDFPSQIEGLITTSKDKGLPGQKLILVKSGKNFMGDLTPVKAKPYDITFEFIYKSPLHITFKAMD